MKNLPRSLAAAAAAAMILVLGACSATSPDAGASAEPAEIAIAIERAPAGGWDPSKWNWSTFAQLSQAAYDGYLHGTPDGTFSPALATEWEWESDTDFRMTLREGVTFTDGAAFDAEAVKTNIEYQSSSPNLKTLESVEVVSDNEVVLHFTSFLPGLERILSQQAGLVVSPEALATPEVLVEEPVGAGPYIYDASASVAESEYVFTKNPDYWDAENVAFETMSFRVIDDAQAAFSALQAGEVDMTWGRYPNVDAAKAAGFEVFEGPGSVLMMQFVDMAGSEIPALADPRVRQALNMAVNREALAASVSPGRVTSQWANGETEAYDPDLDDFYEYDLKKAQELLDEAGYADGFTLPISTTPVNQVVLEAVAADLAKVGVTVELIVKPIAEWVPAATAGQFPVILVPLSSNGSFVDFGAFVLPDGGSNTRKYNDPEAVALFEKAASTRDDDDRIEAWHELSAYFTEDAWTIPLQQTTTFYFYNGDAVEGVERPQGILLPAIYGLKPVA
jgi:peptide/nickel transport system substrate-binding protein